MTLNELTRDMLRRIERIAEQAATDTDARLALQRISEELRITEDKLREYVWVQLRTLENKELLNRISGNLTQSFTGVGEQLRTQLGTILRDGRDKDLPLVEVKNRIKHQLGRTEHNARTLTLTTTAAADRAKRLEDALASGWEYFEYIGDSPERLFCKLHYGQVYHITEIRAMDNKQGLPVEVYCGGYNCQHEWSAVPAPAQAPKPKPIRKPRQPRQAIPAPIPAAAMSTALGTPVENAYTNVAPALQKKVKEALAAIAKVHGDGPLKNIPVELETHRKRQGSLRIDARTGQPLGIAARSRSEFITLWHEIGHHIDVTLGLSNGSRFASEMPQGPFQGVIDAIKQSGAVNTLAAAPIQNKAYWVSETELFARAYADFIRFESGYTHESDYHIKVKGYGIQWEKADFAPIRTEFIKVFRSLGWMK